MLAALSPGDKLAALDILWRDLSTNPAAVPFPDWHRQVLNKRLTDPSAEPPLPLDAAIEDVTPRLNALRLICTPDELTGTDDVS